MSGDINVNFTKLTIVRRRKRCRMVAARKWLPEGSRNAA